MQAEATLFFLGVGLVARMGFFALKGESAARNSLAGMLSGYRQSR